MEAFVQLGNELAPYIGILSGITASLLAKDVATDFAKGISFKLNPMFKEGDRVIIDGEAATILKIGIRQTVFDIQREDGSEVWRYVNNHRIEYLRLEKIIK